MNNVWLLFAEGISLATGNHMEQRQSASVKKEDGQKMQIPAKIRVEYVMDTLAAQGRIAAQGCAV